MGLKLGCAPHPRSGPGEVGGRQAEVRLPGVIWPFSTFFLSTCYMPGTVLRAGTQPGSIPTLLEFIQ